MSPYSVYFIMIFYPHKKVKVLWGYSLNDHINYIIGEDSDHKVSLMMAWAGKTRDVADPWYTGDFTKAYDDILEGCQGMLKQI